MGSEQPPVHIREVSAGGTQNGFDIYMEEKRLRMERVKRQREDAGVDDRHTRSRISSAAEPAANSRSPAKHGVSGASGYDRQEASRDPWSHRNEGGGGGYQQERRQQEQPACGPLPEGWIDCPSMGEPVDLFLPSKVPLGDAFKTAVEPGKRFSPEIAIKQQRHKHREVGLVIDLTNTSRYYREREWTDRKVRYFKLPCRGRDEVPDEETVNAFVFAVSEFLQYAPREKKTYILVHCTHGHNRTGYMIVNYLMRNNGGHVAQRIEQFARARPPGIYKEEYIQALFDAYHERRPEEVSCPSTPEWKRAFDLDLDLNVALNAVDDDGVGEGEGLVKGVEGKEDGSATKGPMAHSDVLGSAIPESQQMELQKAICSLLGMPHFRTFPGSQPVSLDMKNMAMLSQRLYYVTWKADGTRYMMLLCRDGCYVIDRNFKFRRLHMRFPLKEKTPMLDVHSFTLLDGEMVIDSTPEGGQERRYLIYDLMIINGVSLKDAPFSNRFEAIEHEVTGPRRVDQATNKVYLYSMEPCKIRRKDFWLLNTVPKLLHNFIPKLCHEADGLILQGWKDPYVPRTHEGLLKWKYAHMNSVDFMLKKSTEGKWILLLSERGKLRQLEGAKASFPGMTEEQVEELEGKVIECAWNSDEGVWEYMRERTDKDHPNAWHTYEKVMGSIQDNITEDVLLPEIESVCSLPIYEEHMSEVHRQQQQKMERQKKLAKQQQQHHHHHHHKS